MVEALERANIPAPGEASTDSKYYTLYNTKTHEQVKVIGWNLEAVLKKRHKEPAAWKGKPLFSRTPTGTYRVGQYTCMLHPSRPERAEFDIQGMPLCESAHLASEEQVFLHMERKHKSEWARIEKARIAKEVAKNQELQNKQIEAMTALIQAQTQSRVAVPVAVPAEEDAKKEAARARMQKARDARKVNGVAKQSNPEN